MNSLRLGPKVLMSQERAHTHQDRSPSWIYMTKCVLQSPLQEDEEERKWRHLMLAIPMSLILLKRRERMED